MTTTTALRSPFNSTLDAILHFYPLTSSSVSSERPETPSLSTSSAGSKRARSRSHSRSRSRSNSPPPLSAIPLPLPYQPHPQPHHDPDSPNSPSRFINNHTTQIQAPSPRRATSGAAPEPLSPKRTMEALSPNQNLSAPRLSRGGGSSPSRPPHHLNALSPLQSFSPLQSTSLPKTAPAPTPDSAISSSESRRPLVRSMSRKQSMYASAAQWEKGQYLKSQGQDGENTPIGGLFSKITLVKAPDQDSGLKKRSKSSSALAPFTAMSNALSVDPTSDRGPRRSFAAASFGGSRPMHMRTPSAGSQMLDTAHRLQDLKTKPMSPEQIFELANSLKSPVAIPEGGFKGAELKRRKSAGSSVSRRSSHSLTGLADTSPADPPIALEPVEYVQLEDDVLLPFVDRPEEVAELIQHPANDRLFSLLKSTFPKGPPREHWQALSPEEWNWKEFNRHLALTRAESPDYQWIFRARQACRRRSVAMWEKLGVCLGCDGDLLNAGGEDGLPSTWNVGPQDYDEDDPEEYGHTQVWIEGLEAVDPEEAERAERDFAGAFGEIVEDDERLTGLGMASMGAIGEDEEEIKDLPAHKQTPAQRAGNQASIDPFTSPRRPSLHLSDLGIAPHSPSSKTRSARSKSFVGLTIQTSPRLGSSGGSFVRSPSGMSPIVSTPGLTAMAPVYQTERGPDAPLFPGSFKTLSVEPNLGRVAGVGGTPGVPGSKGAGVNSNPLSAGQGGKWRLNRKQSGAGLSESAITFASESDYGPIHDEMVTNR